MWIGHKDINDVLGGFSNLFLGGFFVFWVVFLGGFLCYRVGS